MRRFALALVLASLLGPSSLHAQRPTKVFVSVDLEGISGVNTD